MLVSSGPLSKSLDNPKSAELGGRLNQLDKDLALAELDMLNRMRAPLDNSNPAGALAIRLKEQEVRKKMTCIQEFLPITYIIRPKVCAHLNITLICGPFPNHHKHIEDVLVYCNITISLYTKKAP